MKDLLRIGILGPTERGAVWEPHVRPHSTVREVILSDSLPALGQVDACLVLEEHADRLTLARHVVEAGIHAFVIGQLPSDRAIVERLYRSAEESGTVLQFTNWAYFNPATQWMMTHVRRPRYLSMCREFTWAAYREVRSRYDTYFLEDLSLALKWVDSTVHRIDRTEVPAGADDELVRHWHIRFDNGAVADLRFGTVHGETRHMRFAADGSVAAESDVNDRGVRIIRHRDTPAPLVETRNFAKEEPAGLAVTQFLKAVQMGGQPTFGAYDVWRMAQALELGG